MVHDAGIIITITGVVTGFLLLGSFLSITRSTIIRLITESEIANHHKESELKLLRSQLSPHFLFNVLNNIYGLAIQHDNRVPGLILRLSDLLRHSIYDTSREFILLKNELAYINNYIELERVRMGEKLKLDVSIQETNIDEIMIAPMLLIIFIENAFKHSKNSLLDEIYISIDLHIDNGRLVFTVGNSRSNGNNKDNNEESGIGLAVTKKRLDLLYHGNYSLDIKLENGFYEAKLQLNIKN